MHVVTQIQAYRLHEGGTRARLAILRRLAADSVNNRNPSTRLQPGDWRGARHYTMKGYAGAFGMLSAGSQFGSPVWYTHNGAEFRDERDAHDITHLRHTGWLTDTDDQGSAIGIVARLPHGRFIAGYRWTANDERVYFGGVFNDETDAAHMADEHARVFADNAREHSERYDAMQEAEFNVETALRELQTAFALRHHKTLGNRQRVVTAIDELRDARETLDDATRAYERG